MSFIVKFLDGKKAYICAALIALSAIVEFLAKGDFSITALSTFGQSQAFAGAIAAIRAAISKK